MFSLIINNKWYYSGKEILCTHILRHSAITESESLKESVWRSKKKGSVFIQCDTCGKTFEFSLIDATRTCLRRILKQEGVPQEDFNRVWEIIEETCSLEYLDQRIDTYPIDLFDRMALMVRKKISDYKQGLLDHLFQY